MDYHTIYIKWFYSIALGGIKVQVRKNDFELANEILQSALLEGKHAAQEYNEDICPRCGSTNTSTAVFGKQWAILTWLIVGIPLIWPWIRLRCATCRNTWRDLSPSSKDTSDKVN
jgi:formate dehydrogenase maturation protein FdhE